MTVFRRIPLVIASCAVAGLAVTGCGTQQGGDGSAAGGTATTPAPTGVPTTLPTSQPAPTKPVAVVVHGVIEQGVEPGCYVLTPDQGGPKYLVIARTTPPIGVPVTVRGTTQPGMVSYCQQGTPLQATQIERR